MPECIFCKIARKEIPAKIVHEDEHSVGFLDIQPRSKGMCLVVSKKHFAEFDEDHDMASKVLDSSLIVAEKIKKALKPLAVFFSIIRGQVPHFNVRVYPVYEDQIPLIENKPLEVSEEELNKLVDQIKSINVEWEGRKVKKVERIVEEKPKEPEKKKSEDDWYWERRSMDMA